MKVPRPTRLWFRLAAAAALALFSAACREHSRPATSEAQNLTPPAAKLAEAPADPRALKECAAPIEEAPPVAVQLGARRATLAGYKLSIEGPSPQGQLILGVLGPINEDSAQNVAALKKYLAFFAEQKAGAIIVTGDVGEVAAGIARVLKLLASSNLPVLVVVGNRECRADFTDGVAEAQKEFPNVINMNQVREVEFAEATVISLPGYHDPNFINCAAGCRYYPSTVDEVVQLAKSAKAPVVLISHGPPRGEGSQALDYAISGGNVGDPQINRAVADASIQFGVFSNIKEAGARATDLAGTTVFAADTRASSLFLNPGPADTTAWQMNDGTKSAGMASVLVIQGGQASWKALRLKAPKPAKRAPAPPKPGSRQP
jgi:Icc-related predicted phosphoesterase